MSTVLCSILWANYTCLCSLDNWIWLLKIQVLDCWGEHASSFINSCFYLLSLEAEFHNVDYFKINYWCKTRQVSRYFSSLICLLWFLRTQTTVLHSQADTTPFTSRHYSCLLSMEWPAANTPWKKGLLLISLLLPLCSYLTLSISTLTTLYCKNRACILIYSSPQTQWLDHSFFTFLWPSILHENVNTSISYLLVHNKSPQNSAA